jgi:heme/copper-type cytochrome/quinol oxidase subunit 3
MTYAAFALGVFQLAFIWNLALSWGQASKFSETLSQGQAPTKRTGTTSARLGMWLFIASEAMLFASLLSGYVMLRAGAQEWPRMPGGLPWIETLLLVGASAVFSHERIRLIISNALGLTFVFIKVLSDLALIDKGITPATNLMWACWFTLTAVHAAHVFGGAIFTGWLAGPSYRMSVEAKDRFLARIEATRRYWLFVDAVWLILVVAFYVL